MLQTRSSLIPSNGELYIGQTSTDGAVRIQIAGDSEQGRIVTFSIKPRRVAANLQRRVMEESESLFLLAPPL